MNYHERATPLLTIARLAGALALGGSLLTSAVVLVVFGQTQFQSAQQQLTYTTQLLAHQFHIDSQITTNLIQVKLDTLLPSTDQSIAMLRQTSTNSNLGVVVAANKPLLSAADVKVIELTNLDFWQSWFAPPSSYVLARAPIFTAPQSSLELIIAKPLAQWFAPIRRSLLWGLGLVGIFASGVLLVARALAGYLRRTLQQVVANADQLARGKYPALVADRNPIKELDQLVRGFAAMQLFIQQREDHIAFQANHDALTGLFNRPKIQQEFADRLQDGQVFHVIHLKIMALRHLFDIFGYQAGEALLQAIARRLIRLPGTAARINGGEFIWIPLQSNILDLPELEVQLNRLHGLISNHYVVQDQIITVDCAVAGLRAPQDATTADDILLRLNIACDAAQAHLNHLAIYTLDLEQRYMYRLDVLNKLKNELALPEPRFTLHFQPKFRVATMAPERAEALIRWIDQDLGFVAPDVFIPIAEQSGLIDAISRWVIRTVVKQQCLWQQAGINIQVAINLSVFDLETSTMFEFARDIMTKAGLRATSISFEMTESALMNNQQKIIEQLHRFRDHGYHLSLDDFGTGYSSLAYLKNMPIDELKIDKAFVMRLNEDIDDQSIVKTVIGLCRCFELETVAEGVENHHSLSLLASWHCDWVQGFYLSRPIPQVDYASWLLEFDQAKALQALYYVDSHRSQLTSFKKRAD